MRVFSELERIIPHTKRMQNIKRFKEKAKDKATAALYADEERAEEKKHAARLEYIRSIPLEPLRKAFELRFIEGKEWEEIAEKLGTTSGNIFEKCYRYAYYHRLNVNK